MNSTPFTNNFKYYAYNDDNYSFTNAIGDVDNDGLYEIIVTNASDENVDFWKNNTNTINNSLKINLFYQDMNSVVILDNRLAEIFKINFNTITTYKNVSHISTGNDNTIWLYNQDTNELEVYDYLNNKKG